MGFSSFVHLFRPVYVPVSGYLKKAEDRKYRKRFEKIFSEIWHPSDLNTDNTDKKFYIIFDSSGKSGLFALINSFLRQMKYAQSAGFIPVIDLKNFPNTFFPDNQGLGKFNAWEYFFEQPFDVNLEEVYHSRNVVLGTGRIPESGQFQYNPWEGNETETSEWKKFFETYIRFRPDIKEILEEKYHSLNLSGGGQKVLGVKCRGTDYKIGSIPPGHYYQPAPKQIIDKIESLELEWDKIFLATEDAEVFREFTSYFASERIVYFDNKRITTAGNESWTEVLKKRKISTFDSAMEYLSEMYVLSKCNYLISGLTCASLMLPYMSKRYDYSYMFNLGRHGI